MPSRFNVFNVTKGIGFGQERDYVAEIAHDAEEIKALAENKWPGDEIIVLPYRIEKDHDLCQKLNGITWEEAKVKIKNAAPKAQGGIPSMLQDILNGGKKKKDPVDDIN